MKSRTVKKILFKLEALRQVETLVKNIFHTQICDCSSTFAGMEKGVVNL